MRRLLIPCAILAVWSGFCAALEAATFRIIVNHLGYDTAGSKRLVVQCAEDIMLAEFDVLDAQARMVFRGPLKKAGTVDGWKGRFFHQGDFSPLVHAGTYRIRVQDVISESFALRERLLPESCLADLLYYFRIQRCSGVYDKADRSVAFFGAPERGRVDVHGGWYDASADTSKYLSHQSEGNYLNPQQTPMVVWCLMQSEELLRTQKSPRLRMIMPLLREEALYGADFLVRMQDPSGYFYASVVDGCTKDPAKREICGYKGLEHVKHGEVQAGFREGGGMAIAALARASTLQASGDYPPQRYLAAAELGFKHLVAHNLEYVDDHQENIIDDYCALLAATELYQATTNVTYLDSARLRSESLVKRLSKDDKYAGWWRADEQGARAFFHPSDAGLPVVALLRYLKVENDAQRKAAVEKAVMESLRFELAITEEVSNPFGYARQYVREVDGNKHSAFFFPHRNESSYWWFGENSRLGSLAAAALLGSQLASPAMAAELRTYAANQINWILGLNPYDMCMLQGKGRNNPDECEAGSPNPSGGICNGVTSGVVDEQDIAFAPAPYGTQGDWSWRWKEQWIPHPAWLILALSAEARVKQDLPDR